MRKTMSQLFAERILFEYGDIETLVGDFAYSRRKAKHHSNKFCICGHWVRKETEKYFYHKKKRYYRYEIAQQWD